MNPENLKNTDGVSPRVLYGKDNYCDIEDLVKPGSNTESKTYHRPEGKLLSRYELEQIQSHQDEIRDALSDRSPNDEKYPGHGGPVEGGKEPEPSKPPYTKIVSGQTNPGRPWVETAGNYKYRPKNSGSSSTTGFIRKDRPLPSLRTRPPKGPKSPSGRLPIRERPPQTPKRVRLPDDFLERAVPPETRGHLIAEIKETIKLLSDKEALETKKVEIFTPVKKKPFRPPEKGTEVYPLLLGVRAPKLSKYNNLTKDKAGHRKVEETRGWLVPPIYAPNDRGAIPRVITIDGFLYENLMEDKDENGNSVFRVDDTSTREFETLDLRHLKRIEDELKARL